MIYRLQVLLSILCLCTLPFAVHAQDRAGLGDVQKELDLKLKDLEELEPVLVDVTLDDQKLFETRQNVKQIKARIAEIRELIKPINLSIRNELDDMGAAPAADSEQSEPEAIKELREKLNNELLFVGGVQTQAEALNSKATRFLERLAAIRRDQFVGKILENNVSLFNFEFWKGLDTDKDAALSALTENWPLLFAEGAGLKKNFFWVLNLAAFGLFLLFSFSFIINTRNLRRKINASPDVSFNHKLAFSGYAIVYTFIAGFIGALLVLVVVEGQGLIGVQNETIAYNIFLMSLFAMFALTKTWMLLCSGTVRKTVAFLSSLAVILFCLDFLMLQVGQQVGVPVEFMVAQSFIVTTVFATLILVFFFGLIKKTKTEEARFLIKRRFFYFGFVLGAFILFANALGYVALTRFVFEQGVLLSNLVIAFLILRAIIRLVLMRIEKLFHPKSDKEDHLLLYWMSLTVDATLLIISFPIIAAIVGVEWEGIRLLIYQILSGVKVGGVTISLSSVASAIVLFFVLLFATRMFQKILGEKVLVKTRMVESVRLSIVQVAGYVGLTIALMASISAVGFDLSNLALIAGALSVGIGFGLQSIVSNFVSGLILLFERPIKVGDWVILNSGEGIVKKISVRATEIETFDRTSIIVPNAELISNSVKNWTHKDRTGRVIITIGVSYDADPQVTEDLLMELALENDLILNSPAPTILFDDFGDSALMFKMRFFIRNVSDMPITASKIRQAIWKKLKENEIEIPFPQRDLHIRSSEGLKEIMNAGK